MNLDKLEEFFSGVDWAPFEAEINKLYNLEGRGRRPKPSIAYFKAVLVKMLHNMSSFSQLVERLKNNPDLAKLCGLDEHPSKINVIKLSPNSFLVLMVSQFPAWC